MPNRPPKAWMRDCVAAVRQHGGAKDAGAVCAAVWQRKGPAERRAIVSLEEGASMSAKKKKKGKKKAPKRSKAKRAKKSKKGKRCTRCGHGHSGPCLHMKGGNLCPCPRAVL